MENKLKNKWILLLLVGILLMVVALPTTKSSDDLSEEYALEEELRLKNILEQMEYVGEVKVMLTYRDSRTVEGVAVITEAAGNAIVVKNITDVVQALFDVDSHKIKVMKGKNIN